MGVCMSECKQCVLVSVLSTQFHGPFKFITPPMYMYVYVYVCLCVSAGVGPARGCAAPLLLAAGAAGPRRRGVALAVPRALERGLPRAPQVGGRRRGREGGREGGSSHSPFPAVTGCIIIF
jgi:hypothetical protein